MSAREATRARLRRSGAKAIDNVAKRSAKRVRAMEALVAKAHTRAVRAADALEKSKKSVAAPKWQPAGHNLPEGDSRARSEDARANCAVDKLANKAAEKGRNDELKRFQSHAPPPGSGSTICTRPLP